MAVIPVRSETQAMDWSLVLVSQGIESTIERDVETAAWKLTVDWPDYPRALEAIRQYGAENRGPVWRRELPGTGLVFDWRAVAWCLFLTLVFMLQTRFQHVREVGLMDNAAVRAGEWWRLFTATTLHENLGHLAANLTSGFLFLALAMGEFGPGLALLGSMLAGAAGNLAGLVLYGDPHHGLGASGVVMGALGLLTAQSLWLVRAGLPSRFLMARGLLAGFLLLILLGLNPDPRTDVIAHVAGFVCGAVLGAIVVFAPLRLTRRASINTLAEFLCGGLALLTWWLALR